MTTASPHKTPKKPNLDKKNAKPFNRDYPSQRINYNREDYPLGSDRYRGGGDRDRDRDRGGNGGYYRGWGGGGRR